MGSLPVASRASLWRWARRGVCVRPLNLIVRPHDHVGSRSCGVRRAFTGGNQDRNVRAEGEYSDGSRVVTRALWNPTLERYLTLSKRSSFSA
jgi:hypothetical protein